MRCSASATAAGAPTAATWRSRSRRFRRKLSPPVEAPARSVVAPSTVWRGRAFPLGATWDGAGVNFALFSKHAERVELCLFDPRGRREIERVEVRERTDFVWHCYLPDARPVVQYFQKLGITTVELLPVHAFVDERRLVQHGLRNYWGYSTIGFFAPELRYASKGAARDTIGEFKTMVRTLHEAGLEVILD